MLRFDYNNSKRNSSTPERTQTDQDGSKNRYVEGQDDDKNSFFPISELDGEKNSINHNFNGPERRYTTSMSNRDQLEAPIQFEKVSLLSPLILHIIEQQWSNGLIQYKISSKQHIYEQHW